MVRSVRETLVVDTHQLCHFDGLVRDQQTDHFMLQQMEMFKEVESAAEVIEHFMYKLPGMLSCKTRGMTLSKQKKNLRL